jgi:hypothetical protein
MIKILWAKLIFFKQTIFEAGKSEMRKFVASL